MTRISTSVHNPVRGKFILVRFETRDNPSPRIKNAHSNDTQITVRSIKISERTAFLSEEKRKEGKYYKGGTPFSRLELRGIGKENPSIFRDITYVKPIWRRRLRDVKNQNEMLLPYCL